MEQIDGNKQYSLRWEKHAFNLAAEAGCFFEDESFLDCTLSAEGQCIDAHKIILSASSSYLSSLLKLMPDKHPILIFNDMKFEQLKSIVAFIYNGSVNISENDIHAFLNAAQSLLIKGLYEEEPKDNLKSSDNIKKNKKIMDTYDIRKSNHKFYDRIPPLRKADKYQDPNRPTKRDRPILPKGKELYNNECEDSLYKLQEISFTKYIHQNLNLQPANKVEDKWDESSNDKTKTTENYVVKSWKHNSIDDLNGRNKQNKSCVFNKIRMERVDLFGPRINRTEREKFLTHHEVEAKDHEKEPSDSVMEDKIKKEDENEQRFFIEPKQEIIEEDDISSDNYDKAQSHGMEVCGPELDSEFGNRPMPHYFHPAVESGIPVPLLMCKTSLNEPDSAESNWAPSVNSSVSSNHTSSLQNENVQDQQCRACTQDLPCPTCTKKYKSRYALNRHILYECGKARKSFSCDECGKKVTRQDTLQKHKLIHLVQHLKDKESESELPETTKAKRKC